MKIKNKIIGKYFITVGAVWGLWLSGMILTYLLVVQPQHRTLAQVQKDFTVSNEQYNLAQTAQREDTQKHMAEKLEGVREFVRTFVINPTESSQLTFIISQLAGQCRLGNFTTKVKENAGSLNEQENLKIGEGWLELTFSSTFNQFATFLNSLEMNRPVVFVESAAIKRSDSGSLHDARVLISYLMDKPDSKPFAQAP